VPQVLCHWGLSNYLLCHEQNASLEWSLHYTILPKEAFMTECQAVGG
jgi:hypothetical protein